MKRASLIICAAVLASVALIASQAATRAQERSSALPLTDTSEKTETVYLIYQSDDKQDKGVYMLEDISVREFHGLKCLTGRFVDAGWNKGTTCHIPVDRISSVIEFKSLAELKKAMASLEDDRWK